MEWFTGGVADAIITCRREQALFIVYLWDDTAASTHTTEAWNSDTVLEAIAGNKAVAIKVAKDSVEHEQFSQLYPVLVFPSAFCIGLMGQSLVIMNGQQSSSQIRDKLSEAFEKLQAEVESLSTQQQATPTEPMATPTPSEAQPVATPPQQTTTAPADAEFPSQPPPPSQSASAALPRSPAASREETRGEGEGEGEGEGKVEDGATGTREEKLERAQQKIKQRRVEREEDEFQKEKQAELQRRQDARHLGKARDELEARRNQSWIQERKKAREEDRKAREAIRAKLRQDQMEREAQKRAKGSTTAELRQRSPPSPQVTSSAPSTNNGSCRLQLKLTTGGTIILHMKTDDTLASLRERAAQELDESPGTISLRGTYPSRELTEEMEGQSLAELGLAPSGVVMVRVKRGMTMSGGSGPGLWSYIMQLFQLILNFLTLMKNALVGLFSGGGGQQGQSAATNPSSTRYKRSYSSDNHVRKFNPDDYDDEEDDDSERRNTYNGNSTEQQ